MILDEALLREIARQGGIKTSPAQSMLITEGDSVQWKVTSGEPHTVLFLNNQPPPKEINLDTLDKGCDALC